MSSFYYYYERVLFGKYFFKQESLTLLPKCRLRESIQVERKWNGHSAGFAIFLYTCETTSLCLLHDSSWYQEDYSRSEAQEKLMSQPAGTFIIRGSQNGVPGDFSISVRCVQCVSRFILKKKLFQTMLSIKSQFDLFTSCLLLDLVGL